MLGLGYRSGTWTWGSIPGRAQLCTKKEETEAQDLLNQKTRQVMDSFSYF
jgi:hypothetical protein